MIMRTRTYHELRRYDSFLERYEYLKLEGEVGHATFGFDRHINQAFYASWEWKQVRQQVILRDNGCDLGVRGFEINGSLLIHHINPIDADDIVHSRDWVLNPEFLITTTHDTHNAIHYGDKSLLRTEFVERKPGDTKLW